MTGSPKRYQGNRLDGNDLGPEDILAEGHLTLPDLLELRRLKRGIVRLNTAIDNGSASVLLDALQFAAEVHTNIVLEIMSPGGSVYAA